MKFKRSKKIDYHTACIASDKKSFANAQYAKRREASKGGLSILVAKCKCGIREEFKGSNPSNLAVEAHWIQLAKSWRCPECRRNHVE